MNIKLGIRQYGGH